jgi:hypothetical protein
MSPDRPRPDADEWTTTEPDLGERCAICGRELWSDGLPPTRDGSAWICGDCDQARTFEALDA